MLNPIPCSGLFATPKGLAGLAEAVDQLSGKEKALVMTYVSMTLNMCHELVQEEIDNTEGNE